MLFRPWTVSGAVRRTVSGAPAAIVDFVAAARGDGGRAAGSARRARR